MSSLQKRKRNCLGGARTTNICRLLRARRRTFNARTDSTHSMQTVCLESALCERAAFLCFSAHFSVLFSAFLCAFLPKFAQRSLAVRLWLCASAAARARLPLTVRRSLCAAHCLSFNIGRSLSPGRCPFRIDKQLILSPHCCPSERDGAKGQHFCAQTAAILRVWLPATPATVSSCLSLPVCQRAPLSLSLALSLFGDQARRQEFISSTRHAAQWVQVDPSWPNLADNHLCPPTIKFNCSPPDRSTPFAFHSSSHSSASSSVAS